MFNRYPYTNFHELNLDYFIQHFNEIFTEWEQMYNELQAWKVDTTAELAQWRADVEDDLNDREAALRAELEIWKQQTAEDISDWETATLNALDAWKTAATAQFEAIRVQAAASADAAAAAQTAAETARTQAQAAQTAAESAAASVQASAAQIQQNTNDINELQIQLDNKIDYNEKEVDTETIILPYSDFSAGTLDNDGTVIDDNTLSVSDFIDIHNAIKVYRYGSGDTKYKVEKYAVYDSNKNLLEYHGVTSVNNYEYETYDGHTDVFSYNISNVGAYYIRIVINKNYRSLNYAIHKVNDAADYTLYGNLYSANIIKDEQNIANNSAKTSLLDIEKLVNKNFVILKTGDEVETNTYINPDTGIVSTGNTYSQYDTTDFIKISSGLTYTFLNSNSVTLYDENKERISAIKSSTLNIDGLFDYTFNDNVKYIRITFTKALLSGLYGVCKKNSENTVLCLGDSIFGLNPDIYDVPSAAQKKSGVQIANCAFGGTTASTHGNADYAPFSFHNIADDIYNEDFSAIAAKGNLARFYSRHTATLEAMNWNNVNVITVAYGTNDWNFNKTLDNSENKYDVTTFCGGMRYGIEKILSKYPHIVIALFSPLWRTVEGASVDTTPNGNGVYLREFVTAVKNIAEEYHLPYFDHFNIGINAQTVGVFLRDGTHLSYIDGVNLLGAKVGEELNGIVM